MSIEECYQQIGGDYNQVLARLMTPKLVIRFIGRFLEDNSFSMLEKALAEGNCKEAFRAAHTLKGVCQSLGLGNLLSGHGRGYPSDPFWQYARKYDNDVILGVDAHDPAHLRDTALWQAAIDRVQAMGYHLVESLVIPE